MLHQLLTHERYWFFIHSDHKPKSKLLVNILRQLVNKELTNAVLWVD